MAKRSGRAARRTRRSRSFGPWRFVKDTMTELGRATWPTREETVRLTVIVVSVCAVLAAFLGLFDFGLTELSRVIFR
jgi:preprotein translocase SecE subunit